MLSECVEGMCVEKCASFRHHVALSAWKWLRTSQSIRAFPPLYQGRQFLGQYSLVHKGHDEYGGHEAATFALCSGPYDCCTTASDLKMDHTKVQQ